MERATTLLAALLVGTIASAETFTIDPFEFVAGTEVSAAFKGVTLSTAHGECDVFGVEVRDSLHLISDMTFPVYTTGSTFAHPAGDVWSSSYTCCGDQERVLRIDFKGAVTSVVVNFISDDTDTAILQLYDQRDNLLAETYQRFGGTNSVRLDAPMKTKISYALATFADTGRIGVITYTRRGKSGTASSKALAPVPQTGVTQCYSTAYPPGPTQPPPIDCAGTGQDGEYRMGVEWPDPRFVDNDDGTATDILTGLTWLKDGSCIPPSNITTALQEVAALVDGVCGLSDGSQAGDWRLPNVRQFLSLVDYSRFNPVLPDGHPFILTSAWYWTATPKNNRIEWFIFGFGSGKVEDVSLDPTTLYGVLAVRAY